MGWLVVLGAMLVSGCVHNHTLIATLDRGACNGTCPIYSLYFYDDGDVEYIGSQFVKVQGEAMTRLGPRQLATVHELFARASYFTLGGAYETDHAVDVPLIGTSYVHAGQSKSISHADTSGIPAALTALEAGLDAVVRIERWIGTRGERDRHEGFAR
jgi:hypothetical protein